MYRSYVVRYSVHKENNVANEKSKLLTLNSSNNTLQEQKTYNYELSQKSVLVGKNSTTVKVVTFYTTSDNDLRYVEDVAEELCDLHKLPHNSTQFYEYNSTNSTWYHVSLRWDNKRYRGTSFYELNYNPHTEKPPKKLKTKVTDNDYEVQQQHSEEARQAVFTSVQNLLGAS